MKSIQGNQSKRDTTVRGGTAFRQAPETTEEIILTQPNYAVFGRWSSTFLKGFVALLALSSKGAIEQGSLTRCTSGYGCSGVPEYLLFMPNYVLEIKKQGTDWQKEKEVREESDSAGEIEDASIDKL